MTVKKTEEKKPVKKKAKKTVAKKEGTAKTPNKTTKVSEPKKEKKTPVKNKEETTAPKAVKNTFNFEEVTELKNVGKVKRRSDIKDYKELVKLILSEEVQLVFIMPWDKELLASYHENFDLAKPVKKLPDGVDVISPLVVCETMPKMYAMSMFTEAMYFFLPEDINENKQETCRLMNGLPFEVYQLI